MENQPQDQDAVNLAKSIRRAETGDSQDPYNQKGASGEFGAYQFMPQTYKNYAQKYLGDQNAQPSVENQNKIAYSFVKEKKDSGYNPAQIASMWNAGEGKPDAYKQNWKGTNSEGVSYDTPAYAQKVSNFYQQLKGGSQPNQPNQSTQPNQQAQPNQPESLGGKAVDVAKGVGNFLFPIVGDVKDIFQGKSQKTGLQLFGDTALSVLPFIPGLGEVGEAARAGEAGIEGASLATKALASPVVRGAATGYGAGVASNLSQGKGLGESFKPGMNTLLGAALGGATPKIIEGISGLTKGMSGITPQIENALKDSGMSVDDYNKYIDAAKARTGDIRAPSPLNLAADQLDTAAEKISQATKAAGVAVGEAKKAVGNQTLGDITPVLENFTKQVEDKYGLALTVGKDGSMTPISIPGRSVDISPTERSRIVEVAKKLFKLRGAPLSVASDEASNISKLIDYSKKDLYGNSNDPLEGLLKSTDGQIRQIINQTSPEMAQANANFSGLRGLENEISGMAGKNLQKGELLMKRVFSGDKSGDIQDLFGKIKQITGIDLVNHAVLAKHAVESFGDSSQRSLLDQAIEGGMSRGGGTDIISRALGLGKTIAKKSISNPEKIGRRLVENKSRSGLKSVLTKGAIELGARSSNQ